MILSFTTLACPDEYAATSIVADRATQAQFNGPDCCRLPLQPLGRRLAGWRVSGQVAVARAVVSWRVSGQESGVYGGRRARRKAHCARGAPRCATV